MAIATVGAMGVGDYKESVAVLLFYQLGELFQSFAVGKSRQSITQLMDIHPEYANVTDAERSVGAGGSGRSGSGDGDHRAAWGAHPHRRGHPHGHLYPEHQRPHRRESAPFGSAGGCGHQRLREFGWCAGHPNHQTV